MAKIVDAEAPLSIHVHPDDSYAYENEEGQYGKSECWYIIEAEENSEITIGTHATSREAFEKQLNEGTFEENLRKLKLTQVTFTLFRQVQFILIGAELWHTKRCKSSDISYRVYDYDRKVENGEPRSLNIAKALDVMDYSSELPTIVPQNEVIESHNCTHIVSNDFFTIVKWEISGTLNYMKPREFV